MKAKSVFIMKCAWDKKVMFSLFLGRNLMPNLNFVSCTPLQVLWSPSDSISMESDIVHWWKDNGQSQGGEAPPAQPQEEEVELHHLQQMGRSHGREHRWCETFLGAGEQRDGGGEHTGSLLWGTYWWHRLILAPFFRTQNLLVRSLACLTSTSGIMRPLSFSFSTTGSSIWKCRS